MQLEQMFWSPHLKRESCATGSKTVRRIVCRGEADLVNKSFERSGEESGGREAEERIVGIGRHQA